MGCSPSVVSSYLIMDSLKPQCTSRVSARECPETRLVTREPCLLVSHVAASEVENFRPIWVIKVILCRDRQGCRAPYDGLHAKSQLEPEPLQHSRYFVRIWTAGAEGLQCPAVCLMHRTNLLFYAALAACCSHAAIFCSTISRWAASVFNANSVEIPKSRAHPALAALSTLSVPGRRPYLRPLLFVSN